MANERARRLRREQTDAERKLWYALRRKQLEGFRFRRQHPIGRYIVDFVCLEKMLVIELDGDQHGEADQMAHDIERDQWLEQKGYYVLRIWNREIYENLNGALSNIRTLLRNPTLGRRDVPPPP